MRCWPRPEPASGSRLRRSFVSTCLVLLIGCPFTAFAEGISIEHASSRLVDDSYRFDAKIKFDFDGELLVALEKGVELNIEVLIRVKRERKWLWDPVVAEKRLKFLLQHHPLSNDYIVTDLANHVPHQFPSADAAIRHLGSINNLFLLDRNSIRDGATHTGYMRARLNIDLLPVPLQPAAYVSKEWRLQSPWYKWVIR